MIYIIVTIALTSSFFILFRYFALYKLNSFHAIVTNYVVCVITGIIFTSPLSGITNLSVTLPWVPLGLFIGLLFLLTFNLMSLTVNKVSVTVSGIANKTSLVIPVVASLLVFPVQAKEFTFINYIGILFAILAIVLSSIKKDDKTPVKSSLYVRIGLPLLVFILGGIIDTLLNYSTYKYSLTPGYNYFPVVTFFAAAVTGVIVISIMAIAGKTKVTTLSIVGGIVLGVPNYFSIYFLLKALEAYNNDGALVFTVINTGIIVVTSFMAMFLFKEKLSMLNIAGITLAIMAITFIFI